MDDAFTLLRHATGLLPTGARITSGATVEDVHDSRRQQDWESVSVLLVEFGEEHPVPPAYWPLLTDAARRLWLPDIAEWCGWRSEEARFGTVRAWLSESAMVRLAPLSPDQWRHLTPATRSPCTRGIRCSAQPRSPGSHHPESDAHRLAGRAATASLPFPLASLQNP
ncbi:hypothetical protein AABB02_36770 [Streptomyces rimosus]|uniref:hypothetical protein n=1 Tax=Streptomyces rimosus TaxID=1927 RepID=UPI0031E40160